ncbi:MAG TPA: hypothetical protein VGQ28_11915 [Thermoanaerobaculia bacterium]|jgi:hypothetical protein|nr:hypothetical protein [Thermoanaerobaculia bacterium]
MIMAWWRRIFRLVLRKGRGREQSDDGALPYHVDLWMRELIDEGIDPQAAREEALHSFGVKGSVPPEGAPEDGYPPICMKLSRLP